MQIDKLHNCDYLHHHGGGPHIEHLDCQVLLHLAILLSGNCWKIYYGR